MNDKNFAQLFINVIHGIEQRCMAADGPVTPTCEEITDDELRTLYKLAQQVSGEACACGPTKKAEASPAEEGRDAADARRYRWLTKHAYIGECFTDNGVFLEVQNTDRRVPIDGSVDAAIDAAITATKEPKHE